MKILFVGDVMLGRGVNETLKIKPPSYPWGDTLPVFKDADLRICNLECVLSDVGEPWSVTPKVFHFRTDEKNVQVLLAPEIGMVSLANNHVLDYGYEALFRMMEVLGDNAINYAGVGLDLSEAAEPAICDVDSQKVGLLAFTDNETDWEAKENKPGLLYVPIDENDKRAQHLCEQIKKIRDDVDILIVSAHWGPNWGYTPPKEHVSFAHALIDAGADVVFGHSPHVFRGIEIYKKKVILYSAGNFIDDYAVDEVERNDESFIFVFDADKHTIKRILLYPTLIRHFQTVIAKEKRQKEIVSKMQTLCSKFTTKTRWRGAYNYLEVVI